MVIHQKTTHIPCQAKLFYFIKTWIIAKCNSRVFTGLAVMVYEPLLCSTNMVSVRVLFGGVFVFILFQFSIYFGGIL